METSLLLGIATFAFITSVTPGPNNMMLLASGAQFGFTRTLPHMLGIVFGVSMLLLSVLLGLGVLFQLYPVMYSVLNVAGAAYLLWLAFKIASGPVNGISSDNWRSTQPFTWWQAALFQFVNPKGVFAAITSISLFAELGPNYLFHSLVVIMVSFFCAITSITSWCLLGKFLRRFSENEKFIQVFNYTMSFSLIVCVILIYLKI